jgi:hypothetical protein
MKIQVSSEYTPESITLKTEFVDQGYEDHLHRVFVEVCNLKDKVTRDSLIALGWTPPENKGTMTVPEGYVLVPIEPSEGMMQAGYYAQDKWPNHMCDNRKELYMSYSEPRWKAMIEAYLHEQKSKE